MIRGPEASANYLRDLGHLLKEDALEAKRDAEAASGEDAAFARGRSLAYYEVISLMQQQSMGLWDSARRDESGRHQSRQRLDLSRWEQGSLGGRRGAHLFRFRGSG